MRGLWAKFMRVHSVHPHRRAKPRHGPLAAVYDRTPVADDFHPLVKPLGIAVVVAVHLWGSEAEARCANPELGCPHQHNLGSNFAGVTLAPAQIPICLLEAGSLALHAPGHTPDRVGSLHQSLVRAHNPGIPQDLQRLFQEWVLSALERWGGVVSLEIWIHQRAQLRSMGRAQGEDSLPKGMTPNYGRRIFWRPKTVTHL